MSISSLLEHYGYWVVFVGTFLEGETVLLFAGFAAQRGLLKLPDVILLALAAGTLGDQLYFHLGRRLGTRLYSRFPALAARIPRVERLLARYQSPAILGIRFMYGLRIAGPAAMGALGVPPLKFLLLNIVGAGLWAALVATLGYLFANALEQVIQDLKLVEELVLVGILATGAGWWLARWIKGRRRAR